MRIPRKPPENADIAALRYVSENRIPGWQSHQRATDAQNRYLSWEQFRRRPAPPDLPVDVAWGLQKLARHLQAIPTPFRDKNNQRFVFTEIGPIRHTLHEIDSHARGMLAGSPFLPSADVGQRHLFQSLIEEPYSSSVLEGAATTREEAKKMIEEDRKPKTKDDIMILNNYRAMRFIREHIGEPLTINFIHDVQKIITEDTLDDPKMAGRFRRSDQRIGVFDETTGEELHIPPPAELLTDRVEKICQFANQNYKTEEPFINPVVRAIILHFMIAYEHPYVDGNGRTARALFYWYVMKHGYWLLEYISISKVIKEAPIQYGEAFLNTETDGGDLTYFIIHQLDVIRKSIDQLKVYLQNKANELSEVDRSLTKWSSEGILNHRQMSLINDSIRHPSRTYTITDHQRIHSITYLTARKDLDDLHKHKLLKRSKKGRQYYYSASQNLVRTLNIQN